MLQGWARQAEKCGLKLVEAPINQATVLSEDNPFQSVIHIPLSVAPPRLMAKSVSSSSESLKESASFSSLTNEYCERELLKSLNYILDLESRRFFTESTIASSIIQTSYTNTQYIHRSGISIVQILPEGKGFLWTSNRLHLTSLNSAALSRSTTSIPNPKVLLEEVRSLCKDETRLRGFWNELEDGIQNTGRL